jgi:hypothetical protein
MHPMAFLLRRRLYHIDDFLPSEVLNTLLTIIMPDVVLIVHPTPSRVLLSMALYDTCHILLVTLYHA